MFCSPSPSRSLTILFTEGMHNFHEIGAEVSGDEAIGIKANSEGDSKILKVFLSRLMVNSISANSGKYSELFAIMEFLFGYPSNSRTVCKMAAVSSNKAVGHRSQSEDMYLVVHSF